MGRPDTNQRTIAGARAAGRTLLTEVEAKELLAAYGIPVAPTVHAVSVDQAATRVTASQKDCRSMMSQFA